MSDTETDAERIIRLLESLLTYGGSWAWLTQPREYVFGGEIPLNMIAQGRAQEVADRLEGALEDGAYY